MKNHLTLLFACFVFCCNSMNAQKIEYDEQEWREEFKNTEHYKFFITNHAYDESPNLEMMDFLYFNSPSAFVQSGYKVEKESDHLETIRSIRKAVSYELLEEKNFDLGEELKNYLLENIGPNYLITLKNPTEAEVILKKYEFTFDSN